VFLAPFAFYIVHVYDRVRIPGLPPDSFSLGLCAFERGPERR
jgi:hypothetical protein